MANKMSNYISTATGDLKFNIEVNQDYAVLLKSMSILRGTFPLRNKLQFNILNLEI